MIRGALALAHFPIDRCGRAVRGKRFGEENVVNAQAKVLLESEHAVIPPGKALFGLLEQPETVFHAECQQALKDSAFRFGAQDFALPGFCVMNVAVLGRDVEVAGENQLRKTPDFFREPAFEGGKPGQLVVIFVAADFLAVRHVGADDADAADSRRDQSLLAVLKMGIAADDLGEAMARK